MTQVKQDCPHTIRHCWVSEATNDCVYSQILCANVTWRICFFHVCQKSRRYVMDTPTPGNKRLSNKRRRGWGSQSRLLKGAPVISQCRHNRLVTSLARCLRFLSPTHSLSLSHMSLSRERSFDSSLSIIPRLNVLTHSPWPRPRPHKEYVITGESVAW